MRISQGPRLVAALVVTAMIVAAACGSAASPSPSPAAAPSPSPDPHLSDPADLQAVFTAIRRAGFVVTVNNASEQAEGREPRRSVSATIDGWPLLLLAYSSTKAREVDYGYPNNSPAGNSDPPYTFAGLNVVVRLGPDTGHVVPDIPDQRYQSMALKLGQTLDPFLGPLSQRGVTALELPAPSPTPSPSPSPSPSPKPKPTKKPKN